MWCLAVVVLILRLLATWINGIEVEQVPCYFIFGDSLFDNGNNNDLPTKAKANFPPYGIDFPGGQTGRFSNGRNMGDVIAELLGFENHIPPFASARSEDILKGVNYASGGAGIKDETARINLGYVISMNKQLQNHRVTTSRIESKFKNRETAKKYLKKCIYTVGMGNNDYINNYFLPQFYPTSSLFTPEQYATLLLRQYSRQLKTLYNLGARKIALFGLGLIGCTPGSIAMYGASNGSVCVDFINIAVQIFNTKLVLLVDELNKKLQDANFIYVNIFGISSTPAPGITVDSPCCEVGNLTESNGALTCTPFGTTCPNRAEFIFWDATHPTEVANVALAGRSYIAKVPSDTYPIDIRRLAQL
ncbi:GDSL esterase/lipase [Melia azedarach]|uniref:GDSL esterase/lipase n=1 Tax=Melia azedarach TaxID=155640 RepID=A0ACC1Y771_MELAZ|nr:GDSL esterase/lipase [Melia azedarach]